MRRESLRGAAKRSHVEPGILPPALHRRGRREPPVATARLSAPCGHCVLPKGLFDDRIVLDQSWALEVMYAVFHREKCYRQLRQLRGRFTRTCSGAGVA